MGHTWFKCKIRYEKTMENGMGEKITDPYLVDALSFTEVEAHIIEEITPFISSEYTVSDIKHGRLYHRIGNGDINHGYLSLFQRIMDIKRIIEKTKEYIGSYETGAILPLIAGAIYLYSLAGDGQALVIGQDERMNGRPVISRYLYCKNKDKKYEK